MSSDKSPSQDFGQPAQVRFLDLDNPTHRAATVGTAAEWTIAAVDGSQRYRLKMLMVRGTTDVQELWIVKLDQGTSSEVVHLTGESAAQFVALIRNNAFAPIDETTATPPTGEVIPTTTALSAAYEHDPATVRSLIEEDTTAADVIAIAHRRKAVSDFRRMIDDDGHFDELVASHPSKSTEGVWQNFFESNPWLLGLGMSTHLLIGWDENKLEKFVVGADISGPGKRADAALRTAGVVSLLALAEIKHHRTPLLANGTYRSGCWPPHTELAGAVSQSQGTVQLTLERLGKKVEKKDDAGFTIPDQISYLYRPRSYVVIGRISDFVHATTGEHNESMIRSFELYRRNLYEPVVITFDELLARAEALVAVQAD